MSDSKLQDDFYSCLSTKDRNRPLMERFSEGEIELEQLPEELSGLLYEFRKSMNTALEAARPRFQLKDRSGIDAIYFDYFRVFDLSRSIRFLNAAAFKCEKLAFIGMTYELVAHCVEIAEKNLNVKSPLPTNASLNAQELATLKVFIMLMYIVGHELGHHVHGHTHGSTGSSGLHIEYSESSASSLFPIVEQAQEIEADGYAITFCRLNVSKLPGAAALTSTFCDELILAAVVLYRVSMSKEGDAANLRKNKHPASYIRAGYMIGDLYPSPPADQFLRLTLSRKMVEWAELVLTTSPSISWKLFNLSEPDWQQYEQEIEVARNNRRKELEDHTWTLV